MEHPEQKPVVPSTIWTTPHTWDDPNIDLLFSDLAERVRAYGDAQAGFSVFEEMLAERSVTLYVGMRAKEAEAEKDNIPVWKAYDHERSWKELHQQFTSMIGTLQKSVASLSNPETIRVHLEAGLMAAVEDALSTVDEDTANKVRERLAESLESASF